ncbi:MAG TPA: dihydrodipicolinate synthase family protein [Phytomonospora sp.]
MSGATAPAPSGAALRSRVVYSAAHVVADPLADNGPGRPASLDWDATLAFRRHLWTHGLGVAEAMDTAQRGMGLDWAATQELIRRSAAEAAAVGGLIACGAGTDQLSGPSTLDDVMAAYEEQLAVVDAAGAIPILMCSRALAAAATGPDDYTRVYDRLLSQVSRPVILHWLGPMFDPALTGYWGSDDLSAAAETMLAVIAAHESKVDGVKISLLDADREIAFRRRLPDSVRCYTGDDFNYPQLIEGDEEGFSHALLGIFDPLAAHASAAVARLAAGDAKGFREILDPTVTLARHTFAAPTFNYKTGVVFLAWLAGHQDAFRMVGGLENARDIPYLARLFTLADEAGLYPDPEAAAAKMRALLTVAGVAQ